MRISLLSRKKKRRGLPRKPIRRTGAAFHTVASQSWQQPRRKAGQPAATARRSRAEKLQPRTEVPSAEVRIAVPGWLLQGLKRVRWYSALALALLLALLVYASADRRFFVYQAAIVGAHYLQPEAIYEASGVHEQNVFWLDPQAVGQRIAELDGIRTVRVRCGLPANVTIEVEERQPAALLRSIGQGRDYWLDGEGTVLPWHGDPMAGEMVFIIDRSNQQLEVGDQVEPNDIVQSVRQIAAEMPGVRLFYYQHDRGLSFSDASSNRGWIVFIGNGDDLQRKMQALGVVAEYLVTKGIQPTAVDVRWPTRPFYVLGNDGSNQGGQ